MYLIGQHLHVMSQESGDNLDVVAQCTSTLLFALPHATDLPLIRAELLNRLAIPIIAVRHQFSSCGPRLLHADPIGSAFLSHAS
jgi:hypothetical protein